MKQKHYFLLLLCVSQLLFAQKNNFKIPDSLQNKSFDYLDKNIYAFKSDPAKMLAYVHTFLSKAKKERNWEKMVQGYKYLVHRSPDPLKLIYADSMILAAKKSKNTDLIGSTYLTKGIVYYEKKRMHQALRNYSLANTSLSLSDDYYLRYKVKYNIGLIESYKENYDQAIALFKECVDYYKKNIENARPYLNSLHCLALNYNKIGNYDLCSQTNNLGLSEGIRLKNEEMKSYFIHCEGVNQYFKQNYSSAITKLKAALHPMVERKDFANESVAYFFIGKSLWQLKKFEEALPYFKRVDQIFNEKDYLRPDLREMYTLLIEYYKTKGDAPSEMYYMRQNTKAEKVYTKHYKYIVTKSEREKTRIQFFEKEKVKTKLEKASQYNLYFASGGIGLLAITFFFIYRNFTNKRAWDEKFQELLLKKKDDAPSKSKTKKYLIADLNPEKVSKMLQDLKKFEKDLKFLEKDLKITNLATAFNCSPKYLSIVIAHHKGKNFATYINDLKVDYLIHLLDTKPMMKKYSQATLIEAVGFTSIRRLTTSFYSRTKIPLSTYLTLLQKELDKK